MTLHTRQERWPANNTVLIVGSLNQKVGLEASFAMPQVGPKRRMPMSDRLFDELLHHPAQGHLASGINPEGLSLTQRSTIELSQAIGRRGCEDIIGVVMPEELWSTVELQSDKLWRIPVALVYGRSNFRALMPGAAPINE